MDAIQDVAEKIVDLDTHRRIEIVQVWRGQYLLRVTNLDAERRELDKNKGELKGEEMTYLMRSILFILCAQNYCDCELQNGSTDRNLKLHRAEGYTFSRALALKLGLYVVLLDKLLVNTFLRDSYTAATWNEHNNEPRIIIF